MNAKSLIILALLIVSAVSAQMSMDMPDENAAEKPFCVSQPWASNCTDYTYPVEMINADNTNLCKAMSFMTGCSVGKLCEAEADTLSQKSFCNPFSILADTCANDMPRMGGCNNYVSMCTSNSTVKQCDIEPLASIPTTADVNKAVRSICTSHTMDGCEKCTFASETAYGDCDLLAVYSDLCVAMPDMDECKQWNALCNADTDKSLSSYCGTDRSTTPPVMKMYFHNEITYVLFYGWVPRTGAQFFGTFLTMVVLGIVVEALMAFRPHIEKKLLTDLIQSHETQAKLLDSDANSPKTTLKPRYLYTAKSILMTPLLFLLRGSEVLIGYFLMLAAMSFNVIVFTSVIVGLALGHVIFLPYRLTSQSAEKESATACC